MIGLRNYHAVTNSVLPIVIEELDIFTTNNISIFANRVACGTYDPPIEINKDPFDDKSLHRDIRNHIKIKNILFYVCHLDTILNYSYDYSHFSQCFDYLLFCHVFILLLYRKE